MTSERPWEFLRCRGFFFFLLGCKFNDSRLSCDGDSQEHRGGPISLRDSPTADYSHDESIFRHFHRLFPPCHDFQNARSLERSVCLEWKVKDTKQESIERNWLATFEFSLSFPLKRELNCFQLFIFQQVHLSCHTSQAIKLTVLFLLVLLFIHGWKLKFIAWLQKISFV